MQRITLRCVDVLGAYILCFSVVALTLHACHIQLEVLLVDCDEILTGLIQTLVATSHSISQVEGQSASIGQLSH